MEFLGEMELNEVADSMGNKAGAHFQAITSLCPVHTFETLWSRAYKNRKCDAPSDPCFPWELPYWNAVCEGERGNMTQSLIWFGMALGKMNPQEDSVRGLMDRYTEIMNKLGYGE